MRPRFIVLTADTKYSVTQKDGLSFFFWVLLPQMSEDSEDFICQQDGAPPRWHRDVSTFSEWISTSTMDRSRRERRPGASVLAPEISWSHTMRLFLVRVHKRSSLCTISNNNFGWPKKPNHNCGELSDAWHSSSGVERIQLPSRRYPCGLMETHWTFINFIVSIIKCNLHHICH